MKLSAFETMDPNLLPGLFNTALRNNFDDLADLVCTHDLDREKLEERMSGIGYCYRPEVNQFRPIPKPGE
jgi:hypothetical protein